MICSQMPEINVFYEFKDFQMNQNQIIQYKMPKHKKQSRSRSRSKSPSRNSNIRHDRSRHSQKQKQQKSHYSRQHKKKQYSSSSSPSSSSKSKSKSKSEQSIRQKGNESISHQPNYKVEETKTLRIENYNNKQLAERALTDASIMAGTSVPDEVQLKEDSIYAKYPSIEVSTKIKQLLKQHIEIEGKQYRINFHPYKRIDLNISYDWYCQNCEYKNFARRNKCYRCDYEKTSNCKLNYNTTTSKANPTNKQQSYGGTGNNGTNSNINNCSLMIRGQVITDTEEEVILALFQSICSVKDIRMIRNKMTGQLKDFVFVQFFTPEDAALALKHASMPEFKVRGEKVSVMYSRNKSDDDYARPLPYQKKQRRKDFSKKQKQANQPVQSYYNKQRQLQIQQQKLRPIITIQQLKQKHEQEMRKKASNMRELTEQQSKRRQAQIMAKQWQKQAKMQNTVLYLCVLCRRKFKGQAEMKMHQELSELHRWNKDKYQLSL